MTVYIDLPQKGRTKATATAVREKGVDIKLSDGSFVFDVRAPIWSEDGNEIPLSDVRSALAAGDIEAQYAQVGRILLGESI